MPIDQTKLEELKGKFGKLHLLSVGDAEVVVRTPTRFEFRKWKSDCQDERKKLDAAELLLMPCVVHPEPADFEALVNERPGLVDTFSLKLLEIAGFSQSVEKKAL